jgi:hypothetical protein
MSHLSVPIDNGRRKFVVVLHMGPVTGPVEAVRAAILAERRRDPD